jgi:uncharacterized surface protein with fasciclin (FAS1) repeats
MKKSFMFLMGVVMVLLGSVTAVSAGVENSVYDIAKSNSDFSILAGAVDANGLASVLDGEGAFTVFAPTDAAFVAYFGAGIDREATVATTLLYHVVPGKYNAAAVVNSDMLDTVFGPDIDVEIVGGKVVLNGVATVVATDIEGSNGIIHVIDAVLPPPVNALYQSTLGDPSLSIAEVAAADGRFTTLLAALDAAGLAGTFAAPGNYTVFAPTDAAFAKLPAGTVEALLADPSGALTDILTYHVVPDSLSINQIANDSNLPTLNGKSLPVGSNGQYVTVDGVNIVLFNIRTSNGVIHAIDTVLLP